MAGFSWMSGTLVLLLFVGTCFAAVDQNHLADLVDEIWKKYKINRMFSLAASIPQKENMDQRYDTSQVFSGDAELLKAAIKKKNSEVYKGDRIVAATPLEKKGPNGEDIHAEYRVLQNLDTLSNNNYDKDRDLLLFYVLGSPCYQQCTRVNGPLSILDNLHQIKEWKHYAFVFTYIFKSKIPGQSTDEDQLREALENLGIKSGLGLENIFRCAESDGHMQCTSCSDKNQVAQYCISDNKESVSNQGQPSTSHSVPGNNENKEAPKSSSQGRLDSGNGNAKSTGEKRNRSRGGRSKRGKDNGNGKGLSRRKGGRRRRGKGGRGRRRRRKGRGLSRRKGGRRRGGKGRGLNRRKGGRRRGGKGRGLSRRKGGRRRGGKGRGLNRRKGGRRRQGKGRGLNRRKGGRRRGGKGRGLNRRKGGRRRGGKGRGRKGGGLSRRKGGRRRRGKRGEYVYF